ncbi:MAG: acetylxylan esterase [Kiritimatiellae bacterium]|nr:acetylxylan esterase [Kiritimatiellia bacterium]
MKRLMLTTMAFAAVAAADAASLSDLKLKAKTDKTNPIGYKVGEKMRFDFFIDGVDELPAEAKAPLYVIWTRSGDDGLTVVGTNAISLAKGCSMETKLSVPGIVRIDAQLVGSDFKMFDSIQRTQWDKGIRFLGGAGADTAKMRLTTKEPKDFDAFWAEAKAKLAKVPVKAKRTEATPDKLKGKLKVYAVEIDCFGPRPATGWLMIPENARKKSLPAWAVFDGYNGNNFNVPQVPTGMPANRITLCINAHGYEMVGRDAQYYKDFGDKVNGVVAGATKRNTYALEPSDYDNPKDTYFYYMAMRVMRAFDYLKTLPEWDGKNLEAMGGSQGGLQTMWAAGLVSGLSAAHPGITWGCDIGNSCNFGGPFLTNGWGLPHVPGAFYFDAVLHARRVPRKCKVEITRLGLGDYTCPPRGVLLSYYNLKCPVTAKLVQGSTHNDVPPDPNQSFTISK